MPEFPRTVLRTAGEGGEGGERSEAGEGRPGDGLPLLVGVVRLAPPLIPIVKTSASATPITALVQLCTSLAIGPI
jgi:hypothetical protein